MSFRYSAPDPEIAADEDHLVVARAQLSIGAIDVLQGRQLRHHFAPHMHDFFAIGLVDDGRTRVRYRGANDFAGSGALVTISAGEMHTGAPASDAGWSYRMMYPQRGLLRMALGEALGEDEQLLFPSPFVDDPEVRTLFVSAYQSLVRDDCTLATEERVLLLLRTLAHRHSCRPPARATVAGNGRVVRLARDYIEEHYHERISLTTLAEQCGVSPFHLIRLFGRAYGLPPHAYLKQVRLGRALTMLQQGTLVSRVAYACGFSDQSHLTRNFKCTFGMPPGTYQRSVGALPSAAAS